MTVEKFLKEVAPLIRELIDSHLFADQIIFCSDDFKDISEIFKSNHVDSETVMHLLFKAIHALNDNYVVVGPLPVIEN